MVKRGKIKHIPIVLAATAALMSPEIAVAKPAPKPLKPSIEYVAQSAISGWAEADGERLNKSRTSLEFIKSLPDGETAVVTVKTKKSKIDFNPKKAWFVDVKKFGAWSSQDDIEQDVATPKEETYITRQDGVLCIGQLAMDANDPDILHGKEVFPGREVLCFR